ncbi:MAG: CotH kinase family protein, partial [Bacteroidales bacterium]|nr:CotH kinase family protein [Bacteroidales bacterium]
NMGAYGSPTTWDQLADGHHNALMPEGLDPMRFHLGQAGLDLLVTGENLLSIEAHNVSAVSSDLSSNIYLHAGISSETHFFNDPPDWFTAPPPFPVDSSLLPLMVINTEGVQIPDEPRITARMGLIYNGEGKYQTVDDPLNAYDGQISIERRGESSSMYPKTSYSIETQTDSGTNNNVSLLGLPEENDYVLYGPYGDKSQIRNVISYSLFEQMGHYAPRTRLIELVINNDYKGLYVLTEKIKRDQNRVDMARLTPSDTAAPDITGGYILRVDKTSGMDPSEYWDSNVQPPIQGYGIVRYQYFVPGYDELTTSQRSYIRNYMESFEQVLVSSGFQDPLTGYRSYLDIPSFIDLMILNEFTKDVDAFRLSHYFYKQRDDRGGKIVQGPPWDYNLTFGNNDFTEDIDNTSNWIYNKTMTIYWWARLMQDSWFRNQLYCRWDQLYASILDPSNVSMMVDDILYDLNDAINRNYERWPVFGIYVWPNSFVGNNYPEEEEYLRSWIDDRLSWMELKWGGLCVPVSTGGAPVIQEAGILKVYPNPSNLSHTFVSIPFSDASSVHIRLFDMKGRLAFESEVQNSNAEFAYQLPDLSTLPGGVYTLEVNDGATRMVARVIKQ